MNRMARLLLYRGEKVERQNMIWNMIGSFCYAFASMVLSFLVMRLAGEEQGGIFSFGYSTLGQQLFIVAYFGIRPFQITDGKGEYSFGDYLRHRKLTCLLALAGGGSYLALLAALGRYSPEKAVILVLLVFYKVADGYADVYESEFQRQGSLYLTGKSNCFRTILSVSVFTLFLAMGGELLPACLAAAGAQVGGFLLFNRSVAKALPGMNWKRGNGQTRRLFSETGLLFVSVFLDFYVFSAAKYAIDSRMTDSASGYFNLIFMPTSVIYLVANFVIRPFLTRLTVLWNGRRFSDFLRQLARIGLIILGLTVLAVGLTALLGVWVLGIMEGILGPGYEGSLTIYSGAFTAIVLGGGFYAMANLMYYALVIMRRQKAIFCVYCFGAAAAFVLSGWMVGRWKIMGAALCYLVLMLFLTAGFGVCTWIFYRREKGEHCGNER